LSMRDEIRDQWEENALAFADLIDNRGTPHHRLILNPCVETLLGDVHGKRLLDAGCGEGYLSRYYAAKGARVYGVDISPRLIEQAQMRTEKELDVKYEVGNICRLDKISDNSFDLILCNLVLLNIPCFEDALGEFFRVLDVGGSLVFSIVHPAFDFYGPGTWEMGEKDPATRRREGLFFKMDLYTKESEYKRFWRTREGEEFPVSFSFYHRTLATYVKGLLKAGFRLVDLEEPLPTSDDAFFDRERRIPFFLVVKAARN
jgi:ubiquinone/menaquinone biosynthesis C-methylase UbiE